MPWRLIIMILVVAVFLVFITFNLENRCDISFFGAVITEVPVFITIFSSFVFGLLCSIPLVVMIMRKQKKHPRGNNIANENYTENAYIEPVPEANDKIKKDAAEARKRFLSKRREKNDNN